jgi:hypothetical protein
MTLDFGRGNATAVSMDRSAGRSDELVVGDPQPQEALPLRASPEILGVTHEERGEG